jgi:DNA topoisomerase-1
MSRKLIIVESPTKARTIQRFIQRDADVVACMGHVRDLPQRTLGVDIAHGFQPKYVLTASGKKVYAQLRSKAAKAAEVYLATDPDREGEAIAWHLREMLAEDAHADFQRVAFHEITRHAIEQAFAHPSSLDINKVNAQQARRVLDRIVGYKVSPLLWKHVRKGTSAGRVQSVALRLICEREREIEAFEPVEYWNLTGLFLPAAASAGQSEPFPARLFKLDGEKPEVRTGEQANALAAELESAGFSVADVTTKEKKQRPSPPFITSTLQQAAGSLLRFSARQTMQIAQQLYEGIDMDDAGAGGLITYMRTDSVTVAREAQEQACAFIRENYGEDYTPARPNVYKSRQSAQGAHEAIRPTDVRRTPESVAKHLNPRQLLLYKLIWNRFVASQMMPARRLEHCLDIAAEGSSLSHAFLFRATSTVTIFPGYLRVYKEEEEATAEEGGRNDAAGLPDLKRGDACGLRELLREQKFTEPPKRFSEATLVRELEQNGVGRPSTYATIVGTVQERDYVNKEKGILHPTQLGLSVNDYVVAHMPELFQVSFTAEMESRLDAIEDGEVDWTDMLQSFYDDFRTRVTEIEVVAVPPPAAAARFLDIFPPTLEWRPPEKRGRTVFDDQRFFTSLKQQQESGKKLSDRQWRALLALAARYADQLPNLLPTARDLGIEAEIQTQIEREASGHQVTKAYQPQPAAETQALIAALDGIKWEEPRRSGKRVYDDGKFFASLKQQVDSGKALSTAQQKALVSLAAKYGKQIADFDRLAEELGLQGLAPKQDVPESTARQLMDLLSQITKWEEPRQGRRRSYNDAEFASSVRRQFTQRGSITEKQARAVRKLLGKYREQIQDYDRQADSLNLPHGREDKSPSEPRPEAPESGVCPKCGSPLKLRQSHRGSFYGCSAFPKCRFTKPA